MKFLRKTGEKAENLKRKHACKGILRFTRNEKSNPLSERTFEPMDCTLEYQHFFPKKRNMNRPFVMACFKSQSRSAEEKKGELQRWRRKEGEQKRPFLPTATPPPPEAPPEGSAVTSEGSPVVTPAKHEIFFSFLRLLLSSFPLTTTMDSQGFELIPLLFSRHDSSTMRQARPREGGRPLRFLSPRL